MMQSLSTDKTTSGHWLPGWTRTPAHGITSEVSRFRSQQSPSHPIKGRLHNGSDSLTMDLRRTLSSMALNNAPKV